MKTLTQKILDSAKQDTRYDDNKRRFIDRFDGDTKALSEYLLDYMILSILTAADLGIDLIESLENYYKGPHIKIWIPIVPPGINSTYGVNCSKKGQFYTDKTGKKRKMNPVYKTKVAKEWEESAILPIRNAANYNGFLINKNDKLSISILIRGSQHDVDAPIKMIVDTIARTLDFDDKIVKYVTSETKRDAIDRGVLIEVEKLNG